MENHQLVLVLDFGGQYNQLIARRVREHNVYCEVKPYKTSIEEIKALNPIGIIFTGGPNSVYEEKSPKCDPALFELGVPVLGICCGCQAYGAHPRWRGNRSTGGTLRASTARPRPSTTRTASCSRLGRSRAFPGWPRRLHGKGAGGIFELVAHTDMCPTACHYADEKRGFYGVRITS